MLAAVRRSSSHAARRFYKETGIAAVDDGYQITLDGRALRSPARRALVLPSEPLALAIAAEWDSQLEKIEPAAMPLMSLAATAVDQIAVDRKDTTRTVLKYGKNDTTCFFAGEADEPRLHQLQLEHYLPLLEWVRAEFDVRFEPGFGVAHRPTNDETLRPIEAFFEKLSTWELAALQSATQETKSLVIGLALLAHKLDASQAETVARLEEQVQIDRWGFVEGSHDYDVTRIRFRLASASLFRDFVVSAAAAAAAA
ncbi:hypothetical protein CTAYLR_003547 [Chrysophaeum taylorii]|uniref:ATP synthase mitochondrial F1 complex assembly factor 2 n=1 Tax=Chrysophaeum taylorii TaxID=2483200 RepID=A0AAD7UL47_9STRA|nr:hypothetical protein CTAYLR_003547 [Chrysophaeum taylorii]